MRLFLIVNPHGGTRRGSAILDSVRPLFEAGGAELEIRWTQRPGHALEIAQTADVDGFDGVCVIGGDGTVHEVVNGWMRRPARPAVPLGLIPGGTGNTLHHHYGCGDAAAAARQILAGQSRPLDMARVAMGDSVVWCADIVGWGGIADINGVAERLRRLGEIRYALAALWSILWMRRRFARLTLDDEVIDDRFIFVIGCNVRSTGSGMILAPQAEPDDGKIDVVAMRNTTRREMLRLFRRVFDGSHLGMSCLEYRQVRKFSVDYEGPEPLDLDGENHGRAPFSVEMFPSALRVFSSPPG
jgi:diacylglycerol kinase (ATP)